MLATKQVITVPNLKSKSLCRVELPRNLAVEGTSPDLARFSFLPELVADTDVILGRPWLRTHNPDIDWKKGVAVFNDPASPYFGASLYLCALFLEARDQPPPPLSHL